MPIKINQEDVDGLMMTPSNLNENGRAFSQLGYMVDSTNLNGSPMHHNTTANVDGIFNFESRLGSGAWVPCSAAPNLDIWELDVFYLKDMTIYDDKVLYRAKQNHLSDATNGLENEDYWECLAYIPEETTDDPEFGQTPLSTGDKTFKWDYHNWSRYKTFNASIGRTNTYTITGLLPGDRGLLVKVDFSSPNDNCTRFINFNETISNVIPMANSNFSNSNYAYNGYIHMSLSSISSTGTATLSLLNLGFFRLRYTTSYSRYVYTAPSTTTSYRIIGLLLF